MPTLKIDLGQRAYERLVDLAGDQRRSLPDQAAWMVERSLARRPRPAWAEGLDAAAAAPHARTPIPHERRDD